MMLRRRELLVGKSELPAGYKRCKYLESSGKQYINTLFTPKFGDDIYTVAQRAAKNAPLFYAGKNNQLAFTASEYGYNLGVVYTKYFQGATDAISFKHSYFNIDNRFHSIRFCESGCYVDDVNVCGIATNRLAANTTLYLFRMKSLYGYAKMKNFSIIRDGNCMLNLITCLDISGKPCMYDSIQKQTFYNLGSGEFGYELMDGTYVAPI